jgi:hypothetical protein
VCMYEVSPFNTIAFDGPAHPQPLADPPLREEYDKVIGALSPKRLPARRTLEMSTCDDAILFNVVCDCFTQKDIPAVLKEAHWILLYKKDSKWLLKNYRPIALLSNIYKIVAKKAHRVCRNTPPVKQKPIGRETWAVMPGSSAGNHEQYRRR